MEKEINNITAESGANSPVVFTRFAGENTLQEPDVETRVNNVIAANDGTPRQSTRHVRLLSEGIRVPQRHVVSQSLVSAHNEADDATVERGAALGAMTVHARYRHRATSSQGSFSGVNGSGWSATHSRISSREHLSWDVSAWKEVSAEIGLQSEHTKEYLLFGRFSSDDCSDARKVGDQRHRRHSRSLAAWDRIEVEAFGKDAEKNTPDSNVGRNVVSPIGKKDDSVTDSLFDTAPLGHQQTFSLLSHKDSAQSNREGMGERDVPAETEGADSKLKCPIMTHVIVSFKFLYGVYYVPQSEWGKFNVGELVSVESHTGENTGRVVCDLTKIMQDESLLPPNIAALQREVLYPEDALQPLERVDPVTNKETLLRLPRIIRRGMNKGKKRLYYARRRDSEAYNACQRLIRERGFSLTVSAVEYQVDFKRLTVYCSGSSSAVNPTELLTFIQELASQLRGSAVEVLFSSESLVSLEVTRDITNGAFNKHYQKAMATMAQGENARTPPLQPHPHPQPQPQSLRQHCAPRHFTEVTSSHMGGQPVIPLYNVPPVVPTRQPVLMTTTMGINPMYTMSRPPPLGWCWSTPPPYIAPPHVVQSMGGKM